MSDGTTRTIKADAAVVRRQDNNTTQTTDQRLRSQRTEEGTDLTFISSSGETIKLTHTVSCASRPGVFGRRCFHRRIQ